MKYLDKLLTNIVDICLNLTQSITLNETSAIIRLSTVIIGVISNR